MLDVGQVTIIGTGLLGGSVGLSLKQTRCDGKPLFTGTVTGFGHRLVTAQLALKHGCVDVATDDLSSALRDAQLVILATPLSTFESLFQQIARHAKPDVIVTDVGSTKARVCDLARTILHHQGKRFVGAHPMAGSEQQGPAAARADLFVGRPCVLTPDANTDPAALALVRSLWQGLGMNILTMTPTEHDRHAARISHLPHATAALLVRIAAGAGSLPMASSGFRDCTRVASGDERVWVDIFTTNRDAVVESLDALSEQIAQLRNTLTRENADELRALLASSRAERNRWIEGFSTGQGNANDDAG